MDRLLLRISDLRFNLLQHWMHAPLKCYSGAPGSCLPFSCSVHWLLSFSHSHREIPGGIYCLGAHRLSQSLGEAIFFHRTPRREAAQGLFNLMQGRRSVSDYSVKCLYHGVSKSAVPQDPLHQSSHPSGFSPQRVSGGSGEFPEPHGSSAGPVFIQRNDTTPNDLICF